MSLRCFSLLLHVLVFSPRLVAATYRRTFECAEWAVEVCMFVIMVMPCPAHAQSQQMHAGHTLPDRERVLFDQLNTFTVRCSGPGPQVCLVAMHGWPSI